MFNQAIHDISMCEEMNYWPLLDCFVASARNTQRNVLHRRFGHRYWTVADIFAKWRQSANVQSRNRGTNGSKGRQRKCKRFAPNGTHDIGNDIATCNDNHDTNTITTSFPTTSPPPKQSKRTIKVATPTIMQQIFKIQNHMKLELWRVTICLSASLEVSRSIKSRKFYRPIFFPDSRKFQCIWHL